MRSTPILLMSCTAFLLLILLPLALPVLAGPEEVAAAAAERRAKITPEELAKQIAENTLADADLLPTRPAPKDYTPTGSPEFALLMTPGRGKGCNLKKFPNLQQFLREEAWFYPQLMVDYAIAVDPKLKFYASMALRDEAMIHGADLTVDDLMALLVAGPQSEKDPLLSIELSDMDPSVEELKALLESHGVGRTMVADENHSSRLIFRPDFVPIED